MPRGKLLTLEMLEAKCACEAERKRFKRRFGREVAVTKKLCREVAGKFSFGWAGDNLLPASLDAEWQSRDAALWAEHYDYANAVYAVSEGTGRITAREAERRVGLSWARAGRRRAELFAELWNRPT